MVMMVQVDSKKTVQLQSSHPVNGSAKLKSPRKQLYKLESSHPVDSLTSFESPKLVKTKIQVKLQKNVI